MFLSIITKLNLLLGMMPEYLGVLIFGIALIIVPVLLRRFFNRNGQTEKAEDFGKEQLGAGN